MDHLHDMESSMAIAIDGGLGALTAEANQRGSSGKRQHTSSSAWHRAGRSVMVFLAQPDASECSGG